LNDRKKKKAEAGQVIPRKLTAKPELFKCQLLLLAYGGFLRVACFVCCGKARTITTHESQQTKHSEALACGHDAAA